MKGTHRARGKEWGLGMSKTGKEQIAVLLEITEGEHAGKSITWFGYFTDSAVDRTLDSMRYLGWEGDNLGDLRGLDAHEVEIDIDEETYEGKTRNRVRWINRPARLALREQMDPSAQASFAARMRARAIAHKQSFVAGPAARAPASTSTRASYSPTGFDSPPPGDDDIPF